METLLDIFMFGLWGVILLGVLGWLWSMGRAVWLVVTRSKQRETEELPRLPPMKQIQVRMFGTERDQAEEELKTLGRRIWMCVVGVVFYAAVGWLVYGAVLVVERVVAWWQGPGGGW